MDELQFDTKHGYLSKLTPSDPNGGQGHDDPFRYVNKVLFFKVLIKTFNLITNMAIFTG